MFWFLLGFAVVNFVIGAIVGYKFYAWKEYNELIKLIFDK